MKKLKVIYNQSDGKVTVNAILLEESDNIETDDWNTVMQCLRHMNTGGSMYMIWDRDNWDDKVWG